MQRSPLPKEQPPRHLLHRLDRLFGEGNAFLIVLAIGLATLDFACFTGLRVAAEIQASLAHEAAAGNGVAGPAFPSATSAGFPGR